MGDVCSDPIEGGCANPYTYTYTYTYGDPINHPDLSGKESEPGSCGKDTDKLSATSDGNFELELGWEDLPSNAAVAAWDIQGTFDGQTISDVGTSNRLWCYLNPFCNDREWSTSVDIPAAGSSGSGGGGGPSASAAVGLLTAVVSLTLFNGTTCLIDGPIPLVGISVSG